MMAEYICNITERCTEYGSLTDYERRERIVRCCDCGHCHHIKRSETKGRYGTIPACDYYTCGRNGDYRYFGVDPDGFCAWGEERDHD